MCVCAYSLLILVSSMVLLGPKAMLFLIDSFASPGGLRFVFDLVLWYDPKRNLHMVRYEDDGLIEKINLSMEPWRSAKSPLPGEPVMTLSSADTAAPVATVSTLCSSYRCVSKYTTEPTADQAFLLSLVPPTLPAGCRCCC